MKTYASPAGNVHVPRVDLLTLLFDSALGQAKEDTRIHVDAANPDNGITKAEARSLVKRLAHVLRQRFGIGAYKPGEDVVFTVTCGSPLAPIFFYSVVAAGGIYSGASPESKATELATQMSDAQVSLVVASEDCKNTAIVAAGSVGIAKDRVVVLDFESPGKWTLRSAIGAEDLLSDRNSAQMLDWPRLSTEAQLAHSTVCLLYSSGTTGLPKGVRLSHAGLVASTVCTMFAAQEYQRHNDSFRFDTIAHLPMSNVAGIGLFSCNPFYMGGTTYWMKRYNFEAFIECHKRYRPAYQFSVPPVWLQVAKSNKVLDHFDGLQVASTGSAPISLDVIKAVRSKLGRGRADIYQTWGTTETSGVITAHPWRAYVQAGTWSVGELCPNLTLRILDDQGVSVPEGQPGELLVGGPILAQGYHNRPDANEEAFADPPGFYRTGDIGLWRDGLVYIVDRKKELIKYKANQVAPAELEGLLTSHPLITEAAVIGVYDSVNDTEVPRAYVVRKSGLKDTDKHLTAAEVQSFVKANLAPYKQLRGGVIFAQEIPKSASGKILRKLLRQQASVEAKKARL